MKADPGQIEQVIINLAVNSRDAMPKGGKLTVRDAQRRASTTSTLRNRPPMTPGQYVLLAVTDTGHGMDEKTRRTFSSRSSPPRRSAKAPASASPPCTES